MIIQAHPGQHGLAQLKWLLVLAVLAISFVAGVGDYLAGSQDKSVVAIADGPEVVVYKTPNCGCCHEWMAHLRENGFKVAENNVATTLPIRTDLNIPAAMTSCHTAMAGGYWFEGHVPADLVRRVLTEKPDDINGVAAPGMPVGSPGMEGPNPVTYDLVAHHKDGTTSIYATRDGKTSAHQ